MHGFTTSGLLNPLTDEALVSAARGGNDEAFAQLVSRCSSVLQALSQKYRQYGAEPEDLVQEGLLGLLSAVQTYQSGNNATFRTYAGVCIRNRMLSLVRRLSGSALQAELLPEGDDSSSFPETAGEGPEAVLVRREEVALLRQRLQACLTPLEYRVLLLHIGSYSYREISSALSITEKAVDNALQRVRLKVGKIS